LARPPDERTPEERAAAAAERAARRGQPPPPPQTFAASARRPAPDPPPPAEPSRPAPEPPQPPAEPVTDGDRAAAAEPPPIADDHRAAAAEPPPEPEAIADDGDRAAAAEPPPIAEEPFHDESQRFGGDLHQDGHEAVDGGAEPDLAAARRRRVSAMAARAPQRPRRTPARRPPPPRRRPTTRTHGRRRLALLLALVLLAGAVYVLNATFQPFHGEGEGAVAVTIPEGANAGRIGDILTERGVVDSARFFEINATVTGRRGKLRPGDYTLRRGMSYGGAIDALIQGPKAKVVKTVDVTVPEGLSIREAAPLVDKGPLEGSYLKAARSQRTLRKIRELGAPRGTRTAEGFLFPATYTLIDDAPARNLVDRQLASFGESFAKVDMSYAKSKNLTRYDVLIIASMVEREASLDRERPLVAAVIYNRLADGMTLGIDATIRYFENNWSRPLRVSELERMSPYNTRLNRGLPPTPIGNPGLASLKAAANPARKDYLFYVRKPGKSGEHAFSSTDAQFQRDVARYQASRGE
jgi:UPF0755 protein